MSWSNEETLKFIELYKKEPAIWNPQNEYYKDKNKMQDAWKRIEKAMNIPISELKKKKETLMSTFRLHNKKVSQSIQACEDEVYKPIWIFYEPMQSFLKEVYNPRSSDDFNSDDKEVKDDVNTSSLRKVKVIKTKVRQDNQFSNVPVELQEVSKEMTNAFNTLNQALKCAKRPRVLASRMEDDCDLYGKLLAKRLRQFSETERQEIMYELDGFLLSRSQQSNELGTSSELSDS